ncbi:hypothetical protein [Caviibacter abscessus]|uniref:hypothetical protein n=1 Tax=Caviibacter abscessus TaxID=1766719 RepID=UPI00083811CB|nr:hypothetical protein [Caviibacter abscessus]
MSYRTYLNFETKDRNFQYQIFGNNDYFKEVMEYVTGGNKEKYKELEENDFYIENFEIKDFFDFCYKVLIPVAKKKIKENNKFYQICSEYYFMNLGQSYPEIGKNESVTRYLQKAHSMFWLKINHNYILEFYNLIEFMRKNKIISSINFELKSNMKISLSAY